MKATTRGFIESPQYTTKSDDKGFPYVQCSFMVNNQKYIAKMPERMELKEGTEVILEIADNTALSGYVIKSGDHWGKNSKSLKRLLGPFDRYEYLEGAFTLKSLVSTDRTNPLDGIFDITYSYYVHVQEDSFYATDSQANKLRPGMEVGVVLENNHAILVINKKTGKLIGPPRPWPLLFAFILLVFNLVSFYLLSNNRIENEGYVHVMLFINLLLGVSFLASLARFIKGIGEYKPAKRYLGTKLGTLTPQQ